MEFYICYEYNLLLNMQFFLMVSFDFFQYDNLYIINKCDEKVNHNGFAKWEVD